MRNSLSSLRSLPSLVFFASFGTALFLGCVTEKVIEKTAAPPGAAPAIDPVVLEVQNVVMKKALGGLRDLDQAALEESGWPAGIEEGRRIQRNPLRYMNLGLRRDLAGRQYRVRYFLEKSADRPTTQTAAAKPEPPAEKNEAAPPPAGVTGTRGKRYILITVPATAGGAPLTQADPYVFVVEMVAGRYQVTQSDFIPPDYMAGLDDPAILKKVMQDI